MILSDVKLAVDSRNNKLNLFFKYDSGFDYCRDFKKKYNVTSIESFINADIYELCKCIYYIRNKDTITIDRACSFIDSFSEYVKGLDFIGFNSFSDLLFYLSDFQCIEDVIKYIEEKSNIKARILLSRFRFVVSDHSSNEYKLSEDHSKYIELLQILRGKEKECNISGLLREFIKNDSLMPLIFGLINVHKQMCVDKNLIIEEMETLFKIKPGSSSSKKQLKNHFRGKYDIKSILQETEIINKYVFDEEKKESQFNKNNLREINNNIYSFQLLEKSAKKAEITNAREIVKKVKDEELKRIFLKYIYEHNKKYYEELNAKVQMIRKNIATSYFDELVKYDIIISKDDVNKLMYNTLDDFKEILSILNKISFDKYQILNILKSTSLEVSSKIFYYICEGYLNKDYVLLHPELFNFRNNFIQTIDANILMLSNHGINPKNFINSPNILFDESGCIEDNLKLLDIYNLNNYIKNASSFDFLLDTNLAKKLDSMIELGFLIFIEKDLGILDSENLKRFEVLKSMNMVIDNEDDFYDILNKSKFIINDEYLDEYILKVTDTKKHIDLNINLSFLQEYRADNNTYIIDNIIISFNKVNRLLNEGCDMYDAIFTGMILSDSEYDSLLSKLKNNSYQM